MSAYTRFVDWISTEVSAVNTHAITDIIPVIQSSTTKRSTLQSIADWITQTALSFVQSGAGAIAESTQDELRRFVRPEQFGGKGDGITNDRTAITAADARATSNGCVLFQAGKTYLCSTSLTIAANCYFEPGANISVPLGQTITFSGRVIALDGNPTTGSGSATYSHDGNLFINASGNSGGFSFGITPSSGTDDFFRVQRDVDTSVGILVRNDSTGSSAEGFLHIWGGPTSGSTGSGIRMSANSAAGGSLVDIVAHDNLAFSIIQQSNANIDFYPNNLKSFQIKPSGGTTVNFGTVKGGATGSAVQYETDGTDSDINVVYNTKGAGSHFFRTGTSTVYQLEVLHTASADRRVIITGSNGGNPTISTSAGNLAITPAVVITAASGTAIGVATASTTALGLPAGTTGVSSINLPHGSAPTSPVNGDMWTTTAGLFVRINGATIGPLVA